MALLSSLFPTPMSKKLKELIKIYQSCSDIEVKAYINTLSMKDREQLACEVAIREFDVIQQAAISALLQDMEQKEMFLGFSRS